MKGLAILSVLITLVALLGSIAVSCQKQSEPAQPSPAHAPTAVPPTRPPEIPDGWSLYNGKEAGISFYYPPEWGEVIDYIDYFLKLTSGEAPKGISKEEKEAMEAFESVFKDSRHYGHCLAFSNLDMDWAAHIRITSAEKIQSFISETNKTYASLPETMQERSRVMYLPLLGFWGSCVLEENPSIAEQLLQKVRDIAGLPEGASPEDLKGAAQPVFILFANGIRYMVGPLEKTYGQIVTYDGELSGVTETGREGFDVASRDYWDCILTASDGERLVYISFPLQLPRHSARDNPVDWSEGATSPGTEELLDELQTQFIKFTRTITLLK